MKKIFNLCAGLLFAAFFAVFFTGCFPGALPPPEPPEITTPLKKLDTFQYPDFSDSLDLKGLVESIDQSLIYFNRVPADRTYQYGKEVFSASHMIDSLKTFRQFLLTKPDAGGLNRFIRSNFWVYASVGNDQGEVLFTGYYEPIYPGSLQKTDVYPYPLYQRPDDLLEIDLSAFSESYRGHGRLMARVDMEKKKVLPYYSREQINQIPNFHERSVPIVWLKSRVDRFFLEVQGSGRIVLETGEQLRMHYAANNGKAYSSIGRYLVDIGEIPMEKVSMQAIREWLEKHPDRTDEVLNKNESFVFFQQEKGGPYGSIGVVVTAFRSIATDRKLFPFGALCFLKAQLPDPVDIKPLEEWRDASFFVMNQDTGGAIRGPARADIFCGNGHYAEFTAGHMKTRGQMFFLVLKKETGA